MCGFRVVTGVACGTLLWPPFLEVSCADTGVCFVKLCCTCAG